MMFSYPLYATYFDYETAEWGRLLAWLSFAFSLPVVLYAAAPIWKRFLNSLKSALYGMESLVIMGTGSAFILSGYHVLRGSAEVYFDTLTVIIALVLLGKIIEAKAKMSAKESFYHLFRSLPQRARLGGVFVPLKEIKAGDLIEVLAGESIPLDGEVVKGEVLVDESTRTGESLPILKQPGERVEAGGVVLSGRLLIAAHEGGSLLNRMAEACLLNLETKTQYVRALDPFVRAFVPLVLLLAAGVFFYSGSFETSLAVLVISCPCAIGVAAPLVEARLIHTFAEKGAIVRNRGALFKIPEATSWVFDKTGTLTEGKLEVKGLEALSPLQKSKLKGLSSLSCHPVALSLAFVIEGPGEPFNEVFESQGKGIKGEGVWLGSRAFLEAEGIAVPKSDESRAEVWFYHAGSLFRLELIDKLRQEACSALSTLPDTHILSGDKSEVVEKVALSLGVKSWKGGLSPLEKKKAIQQLSQEGKIVVFVGDGLNDAPALSEAAVGIATASSLGLAQAACDILLTTSSLSLIPEIRVAALKGRRLIRQNLFWAFFYNIIGLGLAAAGLLTPLFAAFAMTASSLMVIGNSFRRNG